MSGLVLEINYEKSLRKKPKQGGPFIAPQMENKMEYKPFRTINTGPEGFLAGKYFNLRAVLAVM